MRARLFNLVKVSIWGEIIQHFGIGMELHKGEEFFEF